jgi:hypothetical protein
MRKSTALPKKGKRGPAPRGSKGIYVKVPPEELATIDKWIGRQLDKPSRPEALRRLAKIALAKNKV